MDLSCLFFFIFLLPGIAVIMSILKQQNQEENEASLNDSNYGYRRISDNNNNSFRNFSRNISNNSHSNNSYETPYTNKYYTRDNYGQTNNNKQSVPYYNQENKLSLFFICKAPINVEKYTNYVIELIDDHGRNLFLNKFQMQISKFKTARVTFTEINESTFLTRRNKTIGQGMTLIKSLKIKFLIGDKARLEISLSLPFTYCISIDNPNRLFNIGIYERASKNLSEDLVINLTRNDMNVIQSKVSANSFEEPTKKQKVISLNSFSDASDEELIKQLFKPDYINQKPNNNADKILNIDPWDISNNQLLNNESLNNQISSSQILKEEPNTKRERINSKRDNKSDDIFSDDIFASSTNKKKSSYEEYLEQQKQKEINDKVEIIEEEIPAEEIINTNDDNVFENGYPVYEVTDENYKYEYNYDIKNDYEEEYEYEDEEEYGYEDEYEEEIKPVYTKQITEQQDEKEKEEILSDKVSNIDSILNKYVKSKSKFTTRSYTPSTYKSATSSYSSKADSIMNSLSSRAKSLSSRINSKFNKDKKAKEIKMISKKFDTSSSSSLSSKYLNKYSKYSKFSLKK